MLLVASFCLGKISKLSDIKLNPKSKIKNKNSNSNFFDEKNNEDNKKKAF